EWRKVREAEKRSTPPSVVFHDLDPVSKTLRDCVSAQTTRVLIDDADAFGEAQRYCRRAMPEMLDRIQLFNGPGDLFSLYDIDGKIEAALEPRAELPSGGWITIERSEEHTSELQSRENLVCRLLLEKKKRRISQTN